MSSMLKGAKWKHYVTVSYLGMAMKGDWPYGFFVLAAFCTSDTLSALASLPSTALIQEDCPRISW
jgi:hypothetical protein